MPQKQYYYSSIIVSTLLIMSRNVIRAHLTSSSFVPCAISTWSFGALAIETSSGILITGGSALDAVEQGIRTVELDNQDQYFVGVGGLPNADGDMELDAAIMGDNCRYGAVMALKSIKNPISVARSVMDKCVHNILCGEGALKWALEHGFKTEEILTEESKKEWEIWQESQRVHNAASSFEKGHDTVGLICIDKDGRICCGTSTSGWKFKHPGRVGDSPVVGSGLYCDSSTGAAVATGDGEEIMRSCLSFLVVEYMRMGHSPHEACRLGISRVETICKEDDSNSEAGDGGDGKGRDDSGIGKRMHRKLTVAVIAMDAQGRVGAASTLGEDNTHRGNPWFPAVCWRQQDSEGGDWAPRSSSSTGFVVIEAGRHGATF